MTDKQAKQAEKSLKWVSNQIPDELGDSREERMLKCIRLYCNNGAEVIASLKSENQIAETQLRELLSALYKQTDNERRRIILYPSDIVELAKDYGIWEEELSGEIH